MTTADTASEDNAESISASEFIAISLWTLRIYLRISPVWTTVFIVVNVLDYLEGLVYTYLFARILDAVIAGSQTVGTQVADLVPYVVALFVYTMFSYFTGYLRSHSDTRLNVESRPELRRLLYEQVNAIGIQRLEEPEVANNLQRANESLYGMQDFLERIVDFFSVSIQLVVTTLIVLQIDIVIVGLIALIAVPKYFVNSYYLRRDWRHHRSSTEESRRAYFAANDLADVADIREISITNAFRYLDGVFTNFFRTFNRKKLQIRTRWDLFGYVLDISSLLIVFGGYVRVLENLLRGAISVGDTTFQFQTLRTFNNAIESVTIRLTSISEHAIRLKDTKAIFDMEPAFHTGSELIGKLPTGPQITIQDLTFRYPRAEKDVITGLNLEIRAGEKIAIVGHNGAGKTTLVKLLAKMYQPTAGKISVNSLDLNEINTTDWYDNLGVLFQDYNTYGYLTARENIALGKPTAPIDEQAVIAAAQKADAHDFIMEFPDKYDQILSERFKGGTRPSTGQWQKIAIARFFYRDAPIIIFDEPTAAIDAVAEAKIFNQIYESFQGKTVIIVSHRFSTVRNADRIIVFDRGRIVEEGSHSELVTKDGPYAAAFKLQAEGYN